MDNVERAGSVSRLFGEVKRSLKTLKKIWIRRRGFSRKSPGIAVAAQDGPNADPASSFALGIPPCTAAFNRLPYELFREIIILSLIVFNKSYTPWESDGILSPPFRASQVCRSWRMTLQSDSSLWTDLKIPFMKPDQIEAMLRLSGSASLKVIIEPYWSLLEPRHRLAWRHKLTSTLASVFREMHRFKVLSIDIFCKWNTLEKGVFHRILPYLRRPAPMLQRCHLEMMHSRDDTLSPAFQLRRNLIQTLFSNDAPNLKYIYQPVFTFEELLPSPLFHNLFGLHLKLTVNTIISRHDILLDILQLSPCLRILDIEVAVSGPKFSPMSADRVVHLSYLEQLLLRGSCAVDTINFILKHISGPLQDVRFLIECRDFPRSKSDSASLLRFLAQRRRSPLAYMEIWEFPARRSIRMMFRENHLPSNQLKLVDKSEISGWYKPERLLTSLRIPFNVFNITLLDMEIRRLNSIALRDLFLSLVSLEHLRVKYEWSRIPKTPVSTDYLTALMPRNIQPGASRGGISRDPLTELLLHIEAHQIALPTGRGISRTHLDGMTTGYIECPCPRLRSLRVGTRYAKFELDEHYVTMLDLCSRRRGKTGYPLEYISIVSEELTLKSEVTAILKPRPGFPVEVRTRRTIIDGKVVHDNDEFCLLDFADT